jgi:hypothetical protein
MMFEEKGDLVVSANIGTQGSAGLNAGWAITDNVGVHTSFNRFDISDFEGNRSFLNDYLWDNELIFYRRLPYNYYGAINFGVGTGELGINNPYYYLKLNRQFFQPSIGKNYLGIFTLAVSLRVSKADYYLDTKGLYASEYDMKQFKTYFYMGDVGNSSFYFFEPAVTWGIKTDYMKFHFQLAGANQIIRKNINYRHASLSAYASLNLDKLIFRPYDRTKKLRWRL